MVLKKLQRLKGWFVEYETKWLQPIVFQYSMVRMADVTTPQVSFIRRNVGEDKVYFFRGTFKV